MDRCPYFHRADEPSVHYSETQIPDRNPRKPFINYPVWCTHDHSPKKKGAIGVLPCEGDPAQCTIAPELRG